MNAKEEALVKQAERGLATAFSSLADLVAANVRICRECALTAFSLHPTQERLERLTELAALPTGPDALHKERTTGPVGMEAVVGEPPPGSGGGPGGGGGGPLGGCLDLTAIKQEDDASGSQAEDADSGVELSGGSPAALAPALTGNRSGSPVAPSGGEEEAGLPYSREAADSLGVSESVIKDLAVVVHSQRWEVLSWRKGWEELEPLCIRYVSDQEKMRSVTKELRFLKVDYSQFKVRMITFCCSYLFGWGSLFILRCDTRRICLAQNGTSFGGSRKATRTASSWMTTRTTITWKELQAAINPESPVRLVRDRGA